MRISRKNHGFQVMRGEAAVFLQLNREVAEEKKEVGYEGEECGSGVRIWRYWKRTKRGEETRAVIG